MTDQHATTDLPDVPASAWALAGVCLLGQLLALADRGISRTDEFWVFVSMVLSALVVGWVSAGVLRARTGRLVLVWVLFAIDLLVNVIGTVDQLSTISAVDLARLAISVAQVVALSVFGSSPYFQRQRERQRQRPRASRVGEPSIAGLVLVAVVVGGLGGLTATGQGERAQMQLRIGL